MCIIILSLLKERNKFYFSNFFLVNKDYIDKNGNLTIEKFR